MLFGFIGAPFSTTITDLNLEVDNYGLNSDRITDYRLALKSEADESVNLSGSASLMPLQVTGEIDVTDVPVSRYVSYYKDRFDFKAAAGRASFGSRYRYHKKMMSLRSLYPTPILMWMRSCSRRG